MSSNPLLELLRASVNQEMTSSPSPVGRWLKGVLREVNDGSLKAEYVVREEMTNPAGILHGGIIATIMDDLIGTTVMSLGGEQFFVSLNLVVDYLAAAKTGDTIIATSNIIKRGRTIINAECWLHNTDGKLLARGTSNLLKVNLPVNG
jgi:uncharacterized protein (TIGR00369 family)